MPVINNAIAWGQLRLLGGWRNLLITGAAYAVLLASTMFAFVRGMRQPASATYGGFVTLFLSLQVMAMLFYGTARVGSAARSDVRTRIIESHRLMPTSPAAAVLGYLFGASLQALVVFAINALLGAIAVTGAGLPMQSWVFSNAVLLAFCLWLWTVVLFFSFRTPWAMWAGIVIFLAFWISSGMLLEVLPGAAVVISPLMGHTIFDMRSGARIDWPYAAAAAAQAVIGVMYFVACTRRYLRDDAIGFGPLLGLLLLAMWVAVSVLGIGGWDEFRMSARWRSGLDFPVAFITSYGSVMLLAILPVSSAVREQVAARAAGARAWAVPVVVVASTIIAAVTVAVQSPTVMTLRPVARTALATLAFLLSMRYVLGIAHRLRWRPRLTALAWLLLTWCVPLLAEFAWEAATTPADGAEQRVSQLAFCSPPAEVYQVWSREPLVHTAGFTGLAIQCVLAMLLGLLFHTAFRSRLSQTGPSTLTPPALTLPPAVAPGAPVEATPAGPASPK